MSGELQEEEAVNLAVLFFWSPWLAYTHPGRICIYSHTLTITLTTLFDIAVLPRSVRIGGEAPGSLASVWVPAEVILKSFIWVPDRESRVSNTVQPDLQQAVPTITCRHAVSTNLCFGCSQLLWHLCELLGLWTLKPLKLKTTWPKLASLAGSWKTVTFYRMHRFPHCKVLGIYFIDFKPCWQMPFLTGSISNVRLKSSCEFIDSRESS